MGLFEKLFPKEEPRPVRDSYETFKLLTGYRPVFRDHYGSIYENALVRSAIEAKARHVSKLKVELQGEAQQYLKTRIRHRPNAWMTWPQFLARCSTILDCTNNLFILPVQDEHFETVGFFPVLPTHVKLIESEKTKRLWVRYEFTNGGRGYVEFDRVAYLVKHQYQDDLFGDTNSALKPTMDLIAVQDQAIKEAAKNSATYRFIAKVNNFTNSEDLANERKRFTEENLGADNGGILLFPNTYNDIKQVTTAAYSVDPNQQNLIRTNVFEYFGVSEEVMQGKAKADELDAFFNSAIEPFAIALSEALSGAIYTEKERSFGNHVYVNANRLQYMSTSEKVSMAQQLGDRGALTIDEIRELFNYPPLPNGEGDVAVIRGEYVAVSEKTGQTVAQTQTSENEPFMNENEEQEENQDERQN